MTKQTIEKKLEELVYLYPTSQEPPKIPKSEYDAIYELFNSVGKDPKKFYAPDNEERIRIQDNRIIYLDARNIELEIISESIGNLKNLKLLIFGYNQIESIPESIGNLNNLERVYFGDNPLNKKSIEFLKELKEKGVNVVY